MKKKFANTLWGIKKPGNYPQIYIRPHEGSIKEIDLCFFFSKIVAGISIQKINRSDLRLLMRRIKTFLDDTK